MSEKEDLIKQEIREYWFPNHIATIIKYGDITVLEWRKPNTCCYAVRYVFDGDKMYITGDIGEAVFWLTWRADVDSFNGISTSYFMEKMKAYSENTYDYDGKEASSYLKEWKDEHIEDMCLSEDEKNEFLETFDELMEDAENCSSEEEWGRECVNQKYDDFITEMDCDYWEWIYSIGRTVPCRILGYIVGLQMASEQLMGVK